MGVVEGRADEIVHAGVGDDEGFCAVLLDVEDASEEGSSLGNDEASRFKEEMGGLVAQALCEGRGVFLYLVGGIENGGAIVDAEAAASVDVADVVAVLAEVGD